MYRFDDLARVSGDLQASGEFKSRLEDFVVNEQMPITPVGEGEHLWLKIRKSGSNTEWLTRQLAKHCGVKPMDVGYAGLKDRSGITTQWFSVYLPGRADPDMDELACDNCQILEQVRHNRKLKRGALSGNEFEIRIRNISGDHARLEQNLERVLNQGVPNYFGEQRFGHHMDNLRQAELLFQRKGPRVSRHQRGLYLSAARSWLFNSVLSERVKQSNWDSYIPGDVLMLAGKSACFADDGSDELATRVTAHELHPTGPLWGEGDSMAQAECLALETRIVEKYELFTSGLENNRLTQERRALRLVVDNLQWQWMDEDLVLKFALSAGSFATVVLRELIKVS